MFKKILTYVFVGAILMTGSLFMSNPEIPTDSAGNTTSYILGDVDGDGVVTNDDVKLIIRAANRLLDLSKNKAMFERADVDGNGKITLADARAALRVLSELEPSTSVPAPKETQQDPSGGPAPEIGGRGLENIPDDELDKVIDSIATEFGTIAILRDNRVAIYKDKKLEVHWNEETTEDDILFDAHSFNPNAEDRWFGIINMSIHSFTSETMSLSCANIDHYSYTGSDWYCFYLVNDVLFSWSPSVEAHIANGVSEVLTYCGYTFYEVGGDYVYVMNADPYQIQKMPQSYIDAHPIEGKRLGEGQIMTYAGMLGPTADTDDAYAKMLFDDWAGTNFSIWGHPKTSIDVDDFVVFSWQDYDRIYAQFGVPVKKTDTLMRFNDVSFCEEKGRIDIVFRNGMLDYIKWTCNDSSSELYNEFLAYLRMYGIDGEVRYPKQGQIEQGVDYRDLTYFAGYDSNAGGDGTYVLVEYQ